MENSVLSNQGTKCNTKSGTVGFVGNIAIYEQN